MPADDLWTSIAFRLLSCAMMGPHVQETHDRLVDVCDRLQAAGAVDSNRPFIDSMGLNWSWQCREMARVVLSWTEAALDWEQKPSIALRAVRSLAEYAEELRGGK